MATSSTRKQVYESLDSLVGHQVALDALLVEVRHLGSLDLEEGLEAERGFQGTNRRGVQHASAHWSVVRAAVN